jgi:N-acyl-D-amino-acid deacylase
LQKFDIVIRNGTVLDGSGAKPVAEDVGITDDLIVEVGDLTLSHAGRVIDAEGKRVAPGFIDIHTHSDISVSFHPQMESILSQGITTQVVGNCSLCLGLALDTDLFAWEKRYLNAHGVQITWRNVDEHLKFVGEYGVGTNYVMLAGQGTLRKRIIGLEDRPTSTDELIAMKELLGESMEAGCWGISTGLEYTPSKYADVAELAELSKVAARFGGFYASHLRNEGDLLEEAVSEAIEIGERAGIAVQLSHHKAEGRKNWGKVRSTLEMVERARKSGLDVLLDQYPYTAFQTAMSVQFLPAWANIGTNEEILARLGDSPSRKLMIDDIAVSHPEWLELGPESPWDTVEIGVCRSHRELQGRTIGDLAREAGRNPIELVMDIILDSKNFISGINYAISEEDIEFVMRHPLTMIGSDAVGTAPRGKLAEDKVHPRSYGTFPRVLGHYVRDRGVISEAEAVRKMTSMPADRIGVRDRGRIQTGQFADIVVYDPDKVGDRATFADPHQFSTGIELVLVNGRVAWYGDSVTDTLAGRVLRKQ